MEKIEIETKKSVYAPLKKFDPSAKDDSFIEVTEWISGEGWDITINDRHFHLHYDELAAINYLTKHLEYGK